MHTNLRESRFIAADLRGCHLNGAQLIKSDLSDAILGGTRDKIAVLNMANLEMATLDRANLQYTVMMDANLRHASLQECNLSNANIGGTIMRSMAGVTNFAMISGRKPLKRQESKWIFNEKERPDRSSSLVFHRDRGESGFPLEGI